MIITRTPFRVSFCGGGSDLPAFYEECEGCVVSTSIDKYMYVTVHPYFDRQKIVLKYSRTEIADSIEAIEHTIFKSVLRDFNLSGVEITSIADVPSGTGLGSSSSFTVGLLHSLYCYVGKYVSKERLASEACETEILKIHSPIGKQDQYAAAYGGLNFFSFHPSGKVFVEPIIMRAQSYRVLEESLLMFYTGDVRSANTILREQGRNMGDRKKFENLKKMVDMTRMLKTSLEKNELDALGSVLDESWRLKKTLSSGISNEKIEGYYELALKNGALGGKLLGAGGGGFLLFYCKPEEQDRLRRALHELQEMPFRLDWEGSKVVYVGDKNWD